MTPVPPVAVQPAPVHSSAVNDTVDPETDGSVDGAIDESLAVLKVPRAVLDVVSPRATNERPLIGISAAAAIEAADRRSADETARRTDDDAEGSIMCFA